MIYFKYLVTLIKHKWYIYRAGRLTGVPRWRLIIHDWTKFLPSEFGRYARWHIGKSQSKKEWADAWHHHQRMNKHHPEFYLLSWHGAPDFYDGIGERISDNIVVLPMPKTYVKEMIADFLAASKCYNGRWDIAFWLNLNGPMMIFHSRTIESLTQVMYEIGYILFNNCPWTWMAGNSFYKWSEDG